MPRPERTPSTTDHPPSMPATATQTPDADALPAITRVVLHEPSPEARARRIVAHAAVVVAGCLRLDGIVVLQGHDGRPLVRYPSRRGRGGRRHPYFEPTAPAFRERFEAEVLRALRLEEEADLIKRPQRQRLVRATERSSDP